MNNQKHQKTKCKKEIVAKKYPQKKESFWEDVEKYVKGDYSHEDPVKTAKDAWKYVD